MTRMTGWIAVGVLGFSAGAASLPAALGPARIGVVYVSPIGDACWTFQHDQGRREMESALKGRVVTQVAENVRAGAGQGVVGTLPRP